MANQCAVGTLQFAIKDAIEKIGIDAVAVLTGLSKDTLYKATRANPERAVPDIPFSRIAAVCAALLRAGHSEAFSALLTKAVSEADEIRFAVLDMAAVMGDIAERTREATCKHSPGGSAITLSEAAKIAASVADMMQAAQTVIVSLEAMQSEREMA